MLRFRGNKLWLFLKYLCHLFKKLFIYSLEKINETTNRLCVFFDSHHGKRFFQNVKQGEKRNDSTYYLKVLIEERHISSKRDRSDNTKSLNTVEV